mmetsp:Transcript_45875/g.53666  ORF Transcript_45875/g.53666 Transcript_45875/m.53666 type:complete len:89 (+) Transcript_45875:589-855(+)|eukprot:CAMPEP_0194355716 /NCGR_PEP_ID=MMETSP0174-20130528/3586_1 /TAXON_ID=216777 /ORGANISM="Proboscia alata, Strain PI-D3" /LENGTH=88 /DNA_ID=CAMNT_0039125091 /DNA_START=250 /DNA_END=516 /DNA_ORIENTATION=+
MERIRAKQQENHVQIAKEAQRVAESKKREEKEKRRVEQPHEKKRGQRLGKGPKNSASSTLERSGFNAMDPSSNFTRGYRSTRPNPRGS